MADEQKPAPLTGKQKTAAAIAAAVAIAAPLTASFEGLRTHPYHDPGDGRMTVCFGETARAMRVYSGDECRALLKQREAQDYAPAVLRCVPALVGRREIFAASIDAAYNAGIGAFCRSPQAHAFNKGEWRWGCDWFPHWYVTAGGKPLPGLARRRAAERALCLKDILP
jgi:lysozyme